MNKLAQFYGDAEISDEGIKKHFKNIDAWEPLIELAWNGFDAKANSVTLLLKENSMGGTDEVIVFDDGDGIDYTTLKDTFGRFYDSAKKMDPAQHGSHGRGRLAFHTICQNAAWYTRSAKGDAVINVDAAKIKRYAGDVLEAAQQCEELRGIEHGTLVKLTNFTKSLPTAEYLREKFSIEFGWFLAVRPNKEMIVNGVPVVIPDNDITSGKICAESYDFEVQVICWKAKLASEKSFVYLMNGRGELVYKLLSTLNNKPGFFTSVCVTSAWADKFSFEQDLLNPDAHTLTSSVWRSFWRQLNQLADLVYEKFLRKKAEEVVSRYEDEGYFPSYAGLPESEKSWRLHHSRELVKQVYIADPQVFNGSKKQVKIIIRLLDRLAVSNENDALLDVLNGALDLNDESLKKLSIQLRSTTFENIVSTIEILQRRQVAVEKMRCIMDKHYREVLETPDLQQIIENNTWLFGAKYETIGAEEDTFTKIVKNLRDKVVCRSQIDDEDVEVFEDLEGAQRQADLFLARKFPTHDSRGQQIFKCIVIEIKRPAISLNKKHLRQLEDYADIIKKFPQFTSEKMHFELILVGRQISPSDEQIKSRLNSLIPRGENGLVADDPRMKLYVLNWYSIFDSFELSNGFMLDKLKLKRAEFEAATKDELVAGLQEAQ